MAISPNPHRFQRPGKRSTTTDKVYSGTGLLTVGHPQKQSQSAGLGQLRGS